MPRRPSPPAAYKDIQQVLDLVRPAVELGQAVEYELLDEGRAINWRQRANAYRVALRRYEEKLNGQPEGTGTSPYDDLAFSRTDNIITIKKLTPEGTLRVDGKELDVGKLLEDDDDNLD